MNPGAARCVRLAGPRGFKYPLAEALTLSTYRASVDLIMDRVRERKAEGRKIGGRRRASPSIHRRLKL